jgi:hypothetical protein
MKPQLHFRGDGRAITVRNPTHIDNILYLLNPTEEQKRREEVPATRWVTHQHAKPARSRRPWRVVGSDFPLPPRSFCWEERTRSQSVNNAGRRRQQKSAIGEAQGWTAE